MNCANPECRQVIEPGNKFCTKCGTPVQKEGHPCEPQMSSITTPEKDPIKQQVPKVKEKGYSMSRPFYLFLVTVSVIILTTIIIYNILFIF